MNDRLTCILISFAPRPLSAVWKPDLGLSQKSSQILGLLRVTLAAGFGEATEGKEPNRPRDLRVPPTDPGCLSR
jgi:hypothetical protein